MRCALAFLRRYALATSLSDMLGPPYDGDGPGELPSATFGSQSNKNCSAVGENHRGATDRGALGLVSCCLAYGIALAYIYIYLILLLHLIQKEKCFGAKIQLSRKVP
jgi:hypothetical protein